MRGTGTLSVGSQEWRERWRESAFGRGVVYAACIQQTEAGGRAVKGRVVCAERILTLVTEADSPEIAAAFMDV